MNMIYQVYLGDRSNLYDACTKSVSEYCKKYGITHIIQREPILKIKPDEKTCGRSKESYSRLGFLPIYEKENAFQYLNEYENIAIIDADIFIKKSAPNIFDQIGDFEFCGVVEREMPLTDKYRKKISAYSKGQYSTLDDVDWKWDTSGAEFMNMGVMVFSNKIGKYTKDQTPKEFLSRSEFKRFIDGKGNWKWSTDQTLLNYWIKKEKIKTKNLSWKWNSLYSAIDDKNIDESYFVHFFLRDHLPGKGENIKEILEKLNIKE